MNRSLNKTLIWITYITLFVFSIYGCSSTSRLKDPDFQAPIADIPTAKTTVDGAVYDPALNLFLFEDVKARRIGDILTVVLVESTNASKSASTSAEKESLIDLPNPIIFGKTHDFGGDNILENQASANREFDGKGDSSQQNSLKGNITVSVHEVLPNGYIRIRGEKLIELNEGSEVVRISGIVRPTDITQDNTVLSTQIANAEIAYKGNGIVSDSSKAGWLLKFFSSVVWPL